jgi:photosystem II stability/assembly factor-like uncharacterized protein
MPSECGNMSLVSAHPERDVVMAGVALQGLFASEKGSRRWVGLGTGDGSATIAFRPSSVVYDPENADTFWVSGTYGPGPGLYRTDDSGTTFRQLGDVSHTDGVSVDLSDPERRTLLSGRHEASDLLRSTDGGATWTDLSATLPDDIGYTSSPLVIDADKHLIGTTNGPASGVFRTTDGGATWTRVHDVAIAGPALRSADGSIYWLLQGGAGLIKSTDDGATWTTVVQGGPFADGGGSLIQLPDGALATVSDFSVITSDDGGVTWQPLGPRLPYPPAGLTYSRFREAFIIWRFDCDASTDNPIPPNAIMRLDVAAIDG